MNIPSGGKLLTPEQSVRFTALSPADKETLIADLVSKMRVKQIPLDQRSMVWRKRWGAVSGNPRRGKRRSGR